MAAELTWHQGLVKTGNGLYNGITGNAYVLHCLSRAYNYFSKEVIHDDQALSVEYAEHSQLWRRRAYLFTKAIFDDRVQDQCREYNDLDKKQVKSRINNSFNQIKSFISSMISRITNISN